MKLIIYFTLFFYYLFPLYAIGTKNITKICDTFTDFGIEISKNDCARLALPLDPVMRLEQVKNKFNEIFSKHRDYLNYINLLKSRVSRSQSRNKHINSSQTLDYLEIGKVGELIFEDNGSIPLDETITIFNNSSSSIKWYTHKALDAVINETKYLKDLMGSYANIVRSETVMVHQSVKINGSCCLIANFTLEPGQKMITKELFITRDNTNMNLEGEFAWGFLMNENNELDFNVSDVIVFKNFLSASVLETPSIDLTNVVHNELTLLNINGNLSFNQLELENVSILPEDSNHAYSLSSLVRINGQETADLCHLTFNQVNLTSLKDLKINSIDLADLLTTNTNQSSSAITIKFKEIQFDGFSLTSDHDFAVKMSTQLSTFIENDNLLYYDNLTLDTINVTSFNTDTWDDWLVNNLNETYHFDNVTINGSVALKYVNDIKYDHDLVTTDEDEPILSKLIFEDELSIYDALATRLLDTKPMDNWVVKGDLVIDGQLNQIKLNQLIDDLVLHVGQTDQLDFTERVAISNCNFEIIDQVNTSNLINIYNISESLTLEDVQINELKLDQVNVTSCSMVKGILESDEILPINQLNIDRMETNGTINTIEASMFLVNGSDQDFTQFAGSLQITSNISIENLNTINMDTLKINGIDLNRLLRADVQLKWPDILTIKSSNITNFTNPKLIKSLSNLLLNDSDQTISGDFSLKNESIFINPISFNTNESSINFWMSFDLDDGDIHWHKLEVDGNLTANNIYILDNLADANFTLGTVMRKGLLVKDDLRSPNLHIYSKSSSWKVYNQSTIASCPNLIVNDLTIDKDLLLSNAGIKPWLSYDSLDGVEYYQEIIFDNLTVNLDGNMEYEKINSHSAEMKLDDVVNLSSNNQLDLHFVGDTEIKGNVTSNSDVSLNLVNMI